MILLFALKEPKAPSSKVRVHPLAFLAQRFDAKHSLCKCLAMLNMLPVYNNFRCKCVVRDYLDLFMGVESN